MATISKISLQNFKFFQQREEFNLGGKNLLVYGENGSGKSSIYWALYTLLECANKSDDGQVSKYFMPGGQFSLTNIFMRPGIANYVDSEVGISFDDGSSFQASLSQLGIRVDMDAQASNYASEFLNYKMLFRIHDFTHSDDIDLFRYFEREVLPYVKFAPVRYWKRQDDSTLAEFQTENAKQILDFIQFGPPKSGVTSKGTPRYPIRREAEFGIYNNIINGFKHELQTLLTYINTEANPILRNDFEGLFTFQLELIEKKPLRLTELQFSPPEFQIKLTLPDFHGATGANKPHTFLNEARLSALGLAMRFAILQRRLQVAKIKLAMLDDFMISLDMNNRDVALNYVFDKVAPNYQTIILTHDRYFYELCKDKIQRKGLSTNWTSYEMFEDEHGGSPIPRVIEDKGKVEKAWALFYSKDFSSAANMVRQATEKLCKSYLTNQERLGGDYTVMKLDGQITKFIQKATTAGIDAATLQDIRDYKDRIMNPSSHYDIETPLFKGELKKAIETLDKLKIATGNLTL